MITVYENNTGEFALAPCALCQDNIKNTIHYHTNLTVIATHPYYGYKNYWYGDKSFVDTNKTNASISYVVAALNGRSTTGLGLSFRNVIVYKEN